MPRNVSRVLPCLACCLWAFGGLAAEENSLWQTDFKAAQAKAKAEKKLLLLDFTGSDWCGWCIRLDQEVFNTEAFRSEAPKHFVLVQLDFPQGKELPEALAAQNAKLADQYSVQGYPTILLLDADGALVARTGYRPGGEEAYLKHLGAMRTAYQNLLAMKAKLPKAVGLDRAKLLDQMIEAYDQLGRETDEIAAWTTEILKLDTDNKAGLKIKYQFRTSLSEAAKLKREGQLDDALATLDKALALTGLTGPQRQRAYLSRAECLFNKKDFSGLIASLDKALAAAPDSPDVSRIRLSMDRFRAPAEAQEAVAKVNAALKDARGIERAKLLDRLIDARTELAQFVPEESLAADVQRYAKEIIALDADNKAGLKAKHEFTVLLAEAAELHESGKSQEALAPLDKAIALPKLAADQLQEAYLLKADCLIAREGFQQALDCLKKALQAAPEGPHAFQIQGMIQRCESEIQRRAAEKGAVKAKDKQ